MSPSHLGSHRHRLGAAQKGCVFLLLGLLLIVLIWSRRQPDLFPDLSILTADREQASDAISQAEKLRQSWQTLQQDLSQAFSETAQTSDASSGLERFVSARNAIIKDLDDLLSEAATAVTKLEEKQTYFNDPHVQSLLPAEVLPELDEALRHQLKDLKALRAEVHTLQNQRLPDIYTRLKRLHTACDLKAQINGTNAAREFWQSEAPRIAQLE